MNLAEVGIGSVDDRNEPEAACQGGWIKRQHLGQSGRSITATEIKA
jgi:hypothetical protein